MNHKVQIQKIEEKRQHGILVQTNEQNEEEVQEFNFQSTIL